MAHKEDEEILKAQIRSRHSKTYNLWEASNQCLDAISGWYC